MYADVADRRVRFVGVDVKDQRQLAIAFVDRAGATYPSLFDPRGEVALAFRGFPANVVPSTILLDRHPARSAWPGRCRLHRPGPRRRRTHRDRPHSRAADVMEPGPSTLRPHEPAARVRERLQKRNLRHAIITDPEGHLLGTVHPGFPGRNLRVHPRASIPQRTCLPLARATA